MRLIAVLINLALLALGVSAFYPFTPAWMKEQERARVQGGEARRSVEPVEHVAHGVAFETDESAGDVPQTEASTSDRVQREVAHLSSKYAGRRPLTETTANGPLSKRDNKFQVMDSDVKGKPMTAGIAQDGTDYSYFVSVHLGSNGKKLYMLLDTGAGSSWVMGSSCTGDACEKHDTFGPGDSGTFKSLPQDFNVTYGSGTVNGKLATDTISLAGISFEYTLGWAYKTSSKFSNFPFDGILGLSMAKGSNDNLLDKLAQTKKLTDNIFCVALNRASDGVNKGEIRFGSMDRARYTGAVTYTPVNSENGDWAIKIDDIAFDGKKAGVGGVSYIDTGTSFIFGPQDTVKKLHSIIPDAESANGQTYTVPCDTDKPLTLTFSGVDFEISPKDWVSPKNSVGKCSSNVYGIEVADGSWLLGDTFLVNVYTVFDKDKKRVGFAKLADGDSAQPSSGSGGTTKLPAQTTGMSGPLSGHPGKGQQTGSPTMGLGGHETLAGGGTASRAADKPKETEASGATEASGVAGGDGRRKAKLDAAMAAAAFAAALVVQ